MNENEFGAKASRFLDGSLSKIQDDKLARLRAGRARAMDAYREPVSVRGLAMAGGPTHWVKDAMRKPFIVVPLAALLLGLGAITYMQQDPDAEIGDLDAALLTGELPVDAFLDKDFDSWLKGSD